MNKRKNIPPGHQTCSLVLRGPTFRWISETLGRDVPPPPPGWRRHWPVFRKALTSNSQIILVEDVIDGSVQRPNRPNVRQTARQRVPPLATSRTVPRAPAVQAAASTASARRSALTTASCPVRARWTRRCRVRSPADVRASALPRASSFQPRRTTISWKWVTAAWAAAASVRIAASASMPISSSAMVYSIWILIGYRAYGTWQPASERSCCW